MKEVLHAMLTSVASCIGWTDLALWLYLAGPDMSDMSKKDAGDGLSQRAKGVTQRAARRAQMIVEAQRLMEELSHRVEAMQRFA